jgi:hypothetical protein
MALKRKSIAVWQSEQTAEMPAGEQVPAEEVSVPWIPDDRKWRWRPESQVLRDLGLSDKWCPKTKKKSRYTEGSRLFSIIGSIRDPDDIRREALRNVIEALLTEDILPGRGLRAQDLIGYYRFQSDRTERARYRSTTDYTESTAASGEPKASQNRPERTITEGYYLDPCVVSDGIITTEMVLSEVDRLCRNRRKSNACAPQQWRASNNLLKTR